MASDTNIYRHDPAASLPVDGAVLPVDMALLASLPTLPLRAKYLVEGFLTGRHRSPLKGSSIEFAEYRAYQAGDELRRVDWRLWGRSDRLCIRIYEEETQLRVSLLLDASASMQYRSSPHLLTKLDYARTVLAAMAHLAQRQGDAVGFGFLAHELDGYLKPRASLPHLRQVMSRLDHPLSTTKTHTAQGLQHLAEILRRRALVVVASDFYEEFEELKHSIQRLRYDGHEVVALQILDPIELDFATDEAGFYVDAEDGTTLPLSPGEVREAYLNQFKTYQLQLIEMMRSFGGDLITLRTDCPPIAALSAYLAHREHRI